MTSNMKRPLHRTGFIVVGLLTTAALFAGVALLPRVGASAVHRAASTSPREIRLVARELAFYLEGQSAPNPAIQVRAGEQIRLVLRNEMPGMSHDLVIKSWQVRTPMIQKKGEEAVVSFRVPDRSGSTTYSCTPHAEIMRGSISIE
jgi:plastocyanin